MVPPAGDTVMASFGTWAGIGVYHDKCVKAVGNSIIRNTIGGVVRKPVGGDTPSVSWRAGVSLNNSNYWDPDSRWLTDTRFFGNVIQPGSGNSHEQRYVAFEGEHDDYLRTDYQRRDTTVNFPLASFTVVGGSGVFTYHITVDGATSGDPVIVVYKGGSLPARILINSIVSATNQVQVTFANLNPTRKLIDAGSLKITMLDH